MIDCHQAMRLLWEYLDNSATAADRYVLEQHLARCQRCCGEMDFAVELRRLLADSRTVDLPDDVRHRLTMTLEELADE
jgi:anti-sigma factor (TIGR02949 family)